MNQPIPLRYRGVRYEGRSPVVPARQCVGVGRYRGLPVRCWVVESPVAAWWQGPASSLRSRFRLVYRGVAYWITPAQSASARSSVPLAPLDWLPLAPRQTGRSSVPIPEIPSARVARDRLHQAKQTTFEQLDAALTQPNLGQPHLEQPHLEQPNLEPSKPDQPSLEQPNLEPSKPDQPSLEPSNLEQLDSAQQNLEQLNLEQSNSAQQNLEQPNLEQFASGQQNLEQLNLEQSNSAQQNLEQPNLEQFASAQQNLEQLNLGQLASGQQNLEQLNLGQLASAQTNLEQLNLGQLDSAQTNLEKLNLEQSNSGRQTREQPDFGKSNPNPQNLAHQDPNQPKTRGTRGSWVASGAPSLDSDERRWCVLPEQGSAASRFTERQLPIAVGSRGPHVAIVQGWLRRRGVWRRRVTTYFDPLMREAVRDFQRQCGLRADGVVDAKTYAYLQRPQSSSCP